MRDTGDMGMSTIMEGQPLKFLRDDTRQEERQQQAVSEGVMVRELLFLDHEYIFLSEPV